MFAATMISWTISVVLGAGEGKPAAEANTLPDVGALLDQATVLLLPEHNRMAQEHAKLQKLNLPLVLHFEFLKSRCTAANLVFLRSAAGLPPSAHPGLQSLTAEMDLTIQVERILHEPRLNGHRPDPDVVCALIDNHPQAKLRYILEHVQLGGKEGIELYYRLLSEAVHRRDAVAAERYFLAALSRQGQIDRDFPEFNLQELIGAYAPLKTTAKLREFLNQELQVVDLPDEIVKGAAYESISEQDGRTAVELLELGTTRFGLDIYLEILEQCAWTVRRTDDLTFAFETVLRKGADKKKTLETVWGILIHGQRYDVASRFMDVVQRQHVDLASQAESLRRIADCRMADADVCAHRLQSTSLSDIERLHLLLASALFKQEEDNQDKFDELIEQAQQLMQKIPPVVMAGAEYIDIPYLFLVADCAQKPLDEERIRELALRGKLGTQRMAAAIRHCHRSNNRPAGVALMKYESERNPNSNLHVERFAECSAEIGDIDGLNYYLASRQFQALEANSIRRISRRLATSISVPAAYAWAKELVAPTTKGNAYLGLVEAIIQSREPSFVPR